MHVSSKKRTSKDYLLLEDKIINELMKENEQLKEQLEKATA